MSSSLPCVNGVPYLPNEADLPPEHSPHKRPWGAFLRFLCIFFALHGAWQLAKGTVVERIWIDQATVKTAAFVINTLTPSVGVSAQGSRLRAPGGGLNVLNGCEGTDVLFLMCAAFFAFPMGWRVRMIGLMLGTAFVFVLNQARVLTLFYVLRTDRAAFDLLHTTVAPIVLVATMAAYFYVWLPRQSS